MLYFAYCSWFPHVYQHCFAGMRNYVQLKYIKQIMEEQRKQPTCESVTQT